MNNLAGKLNKKIELWGNVETSEKNSINQNVWQEQKIKTMWAQIRPQTGSLLKRTAETELSRTTHKIIIRYTAEIKPDMWFIYRGERYNIIYILNPYFNNSYLEIFCEVYTEKKDDDY